MNPPLVVPDAVAAVVRVTGEDAFAYLQSQFSADLRPCLSSPVTAYGFFLTRKGRVEADAIVLAVSPREWWLLSYRTPGAALAEKVLANVVADEVAAEVVAHGTYTLAGDGCAAAAAALGLPAPWPGAHRASSGALVVAGRRGVDAYEVVFSEAEAASVARECIHSLFTTSGPGALEPLRVAAGIPSVPDDCGPGDLPQEAGFGEPEVSCSKGCYLGQEVMARLKAQGRPTRVLTRVVALRADMPAAPAALWAGGAPCGEIRSRANVHGACVAFAMLRERVVSDLDTFSFSPFGEPAVRRHPSV